MSLPSRPQVSVCIVTYNQENYIEECISSVISQVVSFDFEIIVGVDKSIDNTLAVVKKLANIHSNIIIVEHETGVGFGRNYISVHNQAKGKYIAHIDGDDIALPGKLQKQVAILDGNKTLSFCCHQTNVFNDDRDLNVPILKDQSEILCSYITLKRFVLLANSPIVHSSIMYRKSYLNIRSEPTNLIDWHILARLLEQGNGYYLENILGGYRKNKSGSSNAMTGSREGIIKTQMIKCKHMRACFIRNPRCRKEIFVASVLGVVRELSNSRWQAAFQFLKLAFTTFSIVPLSEFVNSHRYYFNAINPDWVKFYKQD